MISVAAISVAAIAAIHHDLNSCRSRPTAARTGRDGAAIRPSVLPKVIPRRPAPTIIGIAEGNGWASTGSAGARMPGFDRLSWRVTA